MVFATEKLRGKKWSEEDADTSSSQDFILICQFSFSFSFFPHVQALKTLEHVVIVDIPRLGWSTDGRAGDKFPSVGALLVQGVDRRGRIPFGYCRVFPNRHFYFFSSFVGRVFFFVLELFSEELFGKKEEEKATRRSPIAVRNFAFAEFGK